MTGSRPFGLRFPQLAIALILGAGVTSARPAEAQTEPPSPGERIGVDNPALNPKGPAGEPRPAAKLMTVRPISGQAGGVTWITRAHLVARVPNFFSYDDPFAASPGKRVWIRVDDRYFVERHPDGTESRFQIFGHATVQGLPGTVVVKLGEEGRRSEGEAEGSFRAFIPDKGASEMRIFFNQAGDDPSGWRDLGWAQGKKMILDHVE